MLRPPSLTCVPTNVPRLSFSATVTWMGIIDAVLVGWGCLIQCVRFSDAVLPGGLICTSQTLSISRKQSLVPIPALFVFICFNSLSSISSSIPMSSHLSERWGWSSLIRSFSFGWSVNINVQLVKDKANVMIHLIMPISDTHCMYIAIPCSTLLTPVAAIPALAEDVKTTSSYRAHFSYY